MRTRILECVCQLASIVKEKKSKKKAKKQDNKRQTVMMTVMMFQI